MTHFEAISKLAMAKVIQNDEAGIRYWANELKDSFTPEEVLGGVDAVIDSGADYVHLGFLRKVIKEVKLNKFRAQQNADQKETYDRWKRDSSGVPEAFKAAMTYLDIKDPTAADREVVVEAHRKEVQKHPHGSELRNLWITAGEVWAGG